MSTYINQQMLDNLDQYKNKNANLTREPEWVMGIQVADKFITFSTDDAETEIQGLAKDGMTITLANLAPINDYTIGLARNIESEGTILDFMPGAIHGHELKIVAPFGSVTTQVHEVLAHNTLMPNVIIARLGRSTTTTTNGQNKVTCLAHNFFGNVFITNLIVKNDLVSISFRYEFIENGQAIIDPKGQYAGIKGAAAQSLTDWKISS